MHVWWLSICWEDWHWCSAEQTSQRLACQSCTLYFSHLFHSCVGIGLHTRHSGKIVYTCIIFNFVSHKNVWAFQNTVGECTNDTWNCKCVVRERFLNGKFLGRVYCMLLFLCHLRLIDKSSVRQCLSGGSSLIMCPLHPDLINIVRLSSSNISSFSCELN
jgi:hypothetical protein